MQSADTTLCDFNTCTQKSISKETPIHVLQCMDVDDFLNIFLHLYTYGSVRAPIIFKIFYAQTCTVVRKFGSC